MPNDSQSFPATFPLNVEKRRKRKDRDGNSSEEDNETPEDLMFSILQDIQTKIVNLTTTVNEVSAKLDNHIDNCGGSDPNVKALKDQILSTQEALMSIDTKQPDKQYEEDKRRKFQCIPKWGELHKKRRDAYYKHFTVSSIADIMENYLSSDEPYIMRNFRPKHSPGEKPERFKLREKHAISTMHMEISQKRITAREQFEIYTEVDSDISKLCDELENPEDGLYLKELWAKEVSTAEGKSQNYFNYKKKPWWLNLPEKYPYTGQQTGDVEPEPNGTIVEVTTNTLPTTNSRNENIDTSHEEDFQMDVGEEDDSTAETAPWVNVTYQKKGRNSNLTRTVRNHDRDQTADKITSQNPPRSHKNTESIPSRGRGGQRGQSTNRSRGGYRGRGVSLGRTRSSTRGRSRGRGTNHSSRNQNTHQQDFQ